MRVTDGEQRMRHVIVTEFLSLDGVMSEPQNWSFEFFSDDIMDFKQREIESSGAQLLGRKTYDTFAEAWPSRRGDYADRLNQSEKFVVTSSPTPLGWQNSKPVATGNVAGAVRALKQAGDGDLLVHGSRMLARALLRAGLIDRLHLVIYPVVLGEGLRLFENGDAAKWTLVESRPFAKGAVLLRLENAASAAP